MYEIHEHAVDRCISRLFNMDPDDADKTAREKAEMMLMEAAYHPERTYKREDKEHPIHIKGELAIPVDNTNKVVPSAYRSDVFI